MSALMLFIVLFVLIDLLIVVFVIRRRTKISPSQLALIRSQWMNIQNHLEKNPEKSIIEADKLLDHILSLKGYQGSLGDKLKAAHSLFSKVNLVWEAHKTRNKIAHELNFKIDTATARSHLNHFARAYRDLGIKI